MYAQVAISWVLLAGPPWVRLMTMSKTLTVNTKPRTKVTSITGLMTGSVTRTRVCQGPAPSIIAASLSSGGTSCSALNSSTVKNGTPSQMLVMSTVT